MASLSAEEADGYEACGQSAADLSMRLLRAFETDDGATVEQAARDLAGLVLGSAPVRLALEVLATGDQRIPRAIDLARMVLASRAMRGRDEENMLLTSDSLSDGLDES
jgi:hypothetical protein